MGEAIAKWGLSLLAALLLGLIVMLSWRFFVVWFFGEHARATVVGFKLDGSGKLKTPIARFTSGTGKTFEISGRSFSKNPSLKEGDRTWVFYDRESPLQGYIKGEPHYAPPLVLSGFLFLILFVWAGAMSVGDAPGLGDPLGLLQRLISMFEPSQRIRFFSFVMAALGTLISTGSFWLIRKEVREIRAEGLYAHARVMGIENTSYSRGTDRARYHASNLMLEFRDQARNTVRIKAGWSAWVSPLRVGDEVGVYCLEQDPQRALIDTWYEIYAGVFSRSYWRWASGSYSSSIS